jgi:hypothetical protein
MREVMTNKNMYLEFISVHIIRKKRVHKICKFCKFFGFSGFLEFSAKIVRPISLQRNDIES